MVRRFFSMSGGFVLGVVVTVTALYLVPLRASEGVAKPLSNKSTLLPERIAALEARVDALEGKSGVHFIQMHNEQPPAPQTWPNDGFGPVQTIPAQLAPTAK